MVSCWADISVCLDDSLTWCLFGLATCFHLNQYTAQRKDQVEWGGSGGWGASGAWRWVNIGHLERWTCPSASLHIVDVFKVFFGRLLLSSISQQDRVAFSWSHTHQLSDLMANLCQSEMRVKWAGKSKYSPSFGWHLGDCSHSACWYALYYVLLTCSQWHSPALAPLR